MKLSFFPSIFVNPPRIKFAEQEADERIELFLRQHWATNIGWVVAATIGYFVPLILPFFFEQINAAVFNNIIPPQIGFSFMVLWYMFITAYVIEQYLHWYFNIYIITNKHLVDITLHSILSRHITEVRLDDVQSARSHINGFLASFFHYGDVLIETAAEKQRIDFLAVPRPDYVSDRVQDLRDLVKDKESHAGRDHH